MESDLNEITEKQESILVKQLLENEIAMRSLSLFVRKRVLKLGCTTIEPSFEAKKEFMISYGSEAGMIAAYINYLEEQLKDKS